MKKNRFIKLASGLLVLCLMTTCVIGATLAKYTTANNKHDSARVAKWGVRITAATNSVFDTKYNTDDEDYEGALSVQASSDKVVAPGTTGNATHFSISGTPEVAVRLSFAMTDVKEVKLTAGTYKYADDDTTVTLATDYTPVVFTLKEGDSVLKTGTLDNIATFLNGYTVDYAPGTNLSAVPTYKLSWAWEFHVDENLDKADTILGDLAAGVSIKKGDSAITAADYSTEVSYTLTITATQID